MKTSVIAVRDVKKKSAKMISFRASEEVARMLSLASDATGETVTDIINRALTTHGEAAILEMMEERQKALTEFFESKKERKG
jgi:uncharacterized protein (DUF1778 family)